jgi:tetratricopeptide (TPR) repeat protein
LREHTGDAVAKARALLKALVVFVLLAWAIANLVALWIFGGNQRKGVRLNNDAVVLITIGDTERARDKLRAAVSGVFPRDVAAMALFNLGIIAMRERDLDSAKKLLRESVDTSSGFRLARATALYEGLSRAQLAFTQAVTGELDAADATLAHQGAPRPSPLGVAFATRARAALALKRGRFDDVVSLLDGERPLLRNALSLQDAILAEAMRAYALSRLGDGYRAAARATAPIYADDLARAYVRSMLPETEPMLVS